MLGKIVFANIFITLSSKGSASGGANITGLPVTSNSASNAYSTFVCPFYGNFSSGVVGLEGRIAPGSTLATLSSPGGGTQSDITDSSFTNTSTFLALLIYLSA